MILVVSWISQMNTSCQCKIAIIGGYVDLTEWQAIAITAFGRFLRNWLSVQVTCLLKIVSQMPFQVLFHVPSYLYKEGPKCASGHVKVVSAMSQMVNNG
jgi:hypothetical protein